MRRIALFVALCSVGAVASGSRGQEPSPPGYCWLAFGPEGTVRVLLRLDGESITLERRLGEKVGAEPERFAALKDCKGVTIRRPDSKVSYVITAVEDMDLVKELGKALAVYVEIQEPVSYRQAARVQLASRAEGAPAVHFDAVLTIGVVENMKNALRALSWEPPLDLALVKGAKPTELFVSVRNARGNAFATKSYVLVDTTGNTGKKCLFPDQVRPVVEVEFPAGKKGAKPITQRYTLEGFC